MGATLDQPFLMELVQHPDERNRLDVEPSRHLGLAHTLVARDVQHHCRLLACDRQRHLPRPALKAPLDQPTDIMDEKSEGAGGFRPAPPEPAVGRITPQSRRGRTLATPPPPPPPHTPPVR